MPNCGEILKGELIECANGSNVGSSRGHLWVFGLNKPGLLETMQRASGGTMP